MYIAVYKDIQLLKTCRFNQITMEAAMITKVHTVFPQ